MGTVSAVILASAAEVVDHSCTGEIAVVEITAGIEHCHHSGGADRVVPGGAGGALQTGRYLQYDDVPHNNLHVSLLNMMGVDTQTFGNPAYCTGPLAGL